MPKRGTPLLVDPVLGELHEKLHGSYNDMKQSTLKTLTILTYLMRPPTAPHVRPYQVWISSGGSLCFEAWSQASK